MMPDVDEYVAVSASALFRSWDVGELLDQANAIDAPWGDATVRPMLRGVDALIREGLLEQCAAWPPEWSTDGVSAYRCLRRSMTEVEIVGLCSAFTAQRDAFATFPVRASFELNPTSTGLSWFCCEVGGIDPSTGEFPQFPEGVSILFSERQQHNCPAQLLVGRRIELIIWTPVVELRFG